MSDGQINVDLRLALKKLREDIAAANKMIKEGLNKTLNVGSGVSDKGAKDSANAQENLSNKVKKVTSSLEQQIAAWKKLQNFRKPVITDVSGSTASTRIYGPGGIIQMSGSGLATTPMAGTGAGGRIPPIIPPPIIPKGGPAIPPISSQDAAVFWRRILTGGMATVRYPMGYGSIIGMNQFMGAFGNTATGGSALSGMGLSGAGGATVASAGILLALQTLRLALIGLQKVISISINASERARETYAKALNSGLGLNFTVQRSMLANTLGVSEKDVYQFGAALAILNPRLDQAAKVSAGMNQTLAPLAFELNILKYDLEALFDRVAVDVVPALRFFVNLLDEMTKSITNMIPKLENMLAIILKAAFPFLSDQKIRNDIAALGGVLVAQTGIGGIISRAIADSSVKYPPPQSFMKQLPVSAWEKMGLVTGMSGHGMIDYARRTATATEKIANAVTNNIKRGVPQAPFGMNPAVSNP